MGTVLVSAGTLSRATKNVPQVKLFHDGTRWWAFYKKSGTADTLFYAYYTDPASPTESSVALASTDIQDGGATDIYYDSGTGVVIVTVYNSTTNNYRYMRGAISGTTITWSANTNYVINVAKSATADYCPFTTVNASGSKVLYAIANNGGNIDVYTSTNAIGTTFADTAGNWSAIAGAISLGGHAKRIGLYNQNTAGHLVIFYGDQVATSSLLYRTFNGTAWSASSSLASGTALAEFQWGTCRVSGPDIKVLAVATASTWYFGSLNETTLTAKTAPAWPTSGLATNSGVALVTDGTDVWAFVIRGDANLTLSYNKYTTAGDSWGGWTDIETTTSGTDVSASFAVAASTVAVLYTKTNGSNYDVVVATVSLGAGETITPDKWFVKSEHREKAKPKPVAY